MLRNPDIPSTAAFRDAVLSVVAAIPRGKVMSYGQIADIVDAPGHARLVGHVLHGAPTSYPCHRVVNSVGRTAPGWAEQPELLRREGVGFKPNGKVDMDHYRWEPKELIEL